MRSLVFTFVSLAFFLNLGAGSCLAQKTKEEKFDVLVYGATPSGIAAAISAARMGMKVALVDESGRLSRESFLPDYQTTFGFIQPLEKEIRSRQPKDALDSTEFWPQKGLKIVEQMLKEESTLLFFEGWKWDGEKNQIQNQKPELLHLVRIRNEKKGIWVSPRIFIDASNDGALAKGFGAEFIMPKSQDVGLGKDSTRLASKRIRGRFILNTDNLLSPNPVLEETISAIQFIHNQTIVDCCIPFGVLLPTNIKNLLVPNCVASSPYPFSILRQLSNQFTLGHTAGVAAALSIRSKTTPPKLHIDSLQTHLIHQKVVLVFVSDVLPAHPDFEWVQKMAIQGWIPGSKARLDEKMNLKDILHIATRTGFSEKEITEMAESKTDRRTALYVIWKVYEKEKWRNDPKANPKQLKE